MVVIAGDVPSYYFGRHPHQEIQMHEDGDQYSMLKPVCKRSWRVDDVEALPYILDKAFRLAEAGRPAPSWWTCPWTCSPVRWRRSCGPAPTRTAM